MAGPRILIVTQMYPSKVQPGLGTFVRERALALHRLGAEIRVISPVAWAPPLPGLGRYSRLSRVERSTVSPEGVLVWHPRYAVLPKVGSFLQGRSMARAVQREYRRRCGAAGWWPDVIDAHFAFPDGFAAVCLSEYLECPVTITCHGSDLANYPDLRWVGRMMRWSLRRADRVIAVAPHLVTRAGQLGAQERRIVLLPNGVDPQRFCLREKLLCRRALGLQEQGPLAVCVGSLDENKNQSVLLGAVKHLQEHGGPRVGLVLVGQGPLRKRLLHQAGKLGLATQVQLVGQVPHDDVPLYMAAADWVVLASKREGWPTVYYEALACGRPIVTSEVDAAQFAVADCSLGIIAQHNTPEGFAQALKQAAATTYDEAHLRQTALEHTWDDWGRRMMRIVSDVTQSRWERKGVA